MAKQISVDIGNTRCKVGIFNKGRLEKNFIVEKHALPELIKSFRGHIILSSVAGDYKELCPVPDNVLCFFSSTPIPIMVDYETPLTLGLDRIAASVGAHYEFPANNSLIIDMGTCVTYDVIDKIGKFQGGAISPGFKIRMKAAAHFTNSLPDISSVHLKYQSKFPSKSTKKGLLKGIEQGLIYEINGFITNFKKEYDDPIIIMTGGDFAYFESYIKGFIFVRPEIVLTGLHKILEYNVIKKFF